MYSTCIPNLFKQKPVAQVVPLVEHLLCARYYSRSLLWVIWLYLLYNCVRLAWLLFVLQWGSSFSKVKQLSQWWTQVFMISDPMFSLVNHVGVSTYAANMEISLQSSFPHLSYISNPGGRCLCSWLFLGWAEMRQLAFIQISLLTLGNHVSSGKLLSFSKPQFHLL